MSNPRDFFLKGRYYGILNAKLTNLLCAKYVYRNMNVAKMYGIATNHRWLIYLQKTRRKDLTSYLADRSPLEWNTLETLLYETTLKRHFCDIKKDLMTWANCVYKIRRVIHFTMLFCLNYIEYQMSCNLYYLRGSIRTTSISTTFFFLVLYALHCVI